MSLALGALMLLALVAAGWPLARRWAPVLVGDHPAGRLALSLALGALVVGLVQVLLVTLGLPARAEVPAALALLGLVAGRRRVGTDQPAAAAVPPAASFEAAPAPGAPESHGARPAPRLGPALTVGLVLVASAALLVTTALPFSGDGSKFWAPKARDLALTGALQAPSLAAEDQLGFHRNYPLLAPTLLAPVFGLGPQDAHAGPKLILGGLLVALLVLQTVVLAGRSRALAGLLLAVPLLVAPETGASIGAGGYVDGLLALWLLLLVLALEALRRGASGPSPLPLVVLAGAGLLSTKLEGGVALLLVGGAWLLTGPARGRLVPAAAGALLLAAPTLWLRTRLPGDPPISDPSLLLDGPVLAARALPLLAGLAGLLVDVAHLGLAPLGILVAARRDRRSPLLVWVGLGLLAFLAAVYLSTTMHLGRHLQTSLPRLVFQWLPALAVLAVAVRPPGQQEEVVDRGR